MSQTVADVLVGVLETDRGQAHFRADRRFLNPLPMRFAAATSNGSASATRKVRRLPPPARPNSPAGCGLRRHDRPRQHPSGRRPLRGQPRPRARSGALRRHAAQVARHRLHPDHRTRSFVPRRLALYPNHLVSGAGAGRYPSGDRRGLCRPRRRPSDPAAGCYRRKGRRRCLQCRDLEAAPNLLRAKPILPKSRSRSIAPAASSSCAAPDATAPPTNSVRCRIVSRRRLSIRSRARTLCPMTIRIGWAASA